jgi:hypothetical protein
MATVEEQQKVEALRNIGQVLRELLAEMKQMRAVLSAIAAKR